MLYFFIMPEASKYNLRGVSASKKEIHDAIKKADKGIFSNAFCKVVPDILGRDEAYCNIMHADGAGTKSSLAYMYWKETGDISVWKGIAQDAIVMNLDDLLCVGDVHGVQKDVSKLSAVVAAEDLDRVLDIVRVDRVATFADIVELLENETRQLHFVL